MASVAPVDLARESYYDRLITGTALVAALGHTAGDERIRWGSITEVFGQDAEPTADEFPMLLYVGRDGDQPTRGVGSVLVQNDILVWPEGSEGGIGKLRDIDAELLGRFYETAWSFDGDRFFCRQTQFRSWRPGPGEPLRRTREFMIHVGGA